jgi:thymidylate kinase
LRRRGVVIALSGLDSAGKTTQRDLLVDGLRARGLAPITIWTRAGYTPGLRAGRRLLRALAGGRKPARRGVSEAPGRYPRRASNLGHPLRRRLWLTAALLDLLFVYGVRLRLWRARGRSVLCDRYLLDCVVDFRVNFPGDRIETWPLWRLVRRLSVRADAAFCILVPPEISLERSRRKERFHWETAEVLRERHRQYAAAAAELGVTVLDGCRPAEEVARHIRASVELAAGRGGEGGPGPSPAPPAGGTRVTGPSADHGPARPGGRPAEVIEPAGAGRRPAAPHTESGRR